MAQENLDSSSASDTDFMMMGMSLNHFSGSQTNYLVIEELPVFIGGGSLHTRSSSH